MYTLEQESTRDNHNFKTVMNTKEKDTLLASIFNKEEQIRINMLLTLGDSYDTVAFKYRGLQYYLYPRFTEEEQDI